MPGLIQWTTFVLVFQTILIVRSENRLCQVCACNGDVLQCDEVDLQSLFSDNNSIVSSNATLTDPLIAQLRYGNLSRNRINRVKQFPQIPLIKLDLSRNLISVIDNSSFKNLVNLTELDLSHNELTSKVFVADIFKGEYDINDYLTSLKKLDLGTNALTTLDKHIFDYLPELEELSLSGNPIKIDNDFKSAFSALKALQFLDLSYVGLYEFHVQEFPKSLEILQMAGNDFVEIPSEILLISNLRILNLDENHFISFNSTNGIQNHPQLEELHISNIVQLSSIEEGAFKNLSNLKIFNCTHNIHLNSIDQDTFSWRENGKTLYPPIQKLILNNDGIASLSNQLLGNWDNIDHLDIGRNPWLCDCNNQWLLSTLIPLINKTNPTLARENMCYLPEEMHGWSLSVLHARGYQMRCPYLEDVPEENHGALLVGILIGFLIGIPLTLGSLLLWLYWRRHLGYLQTSTESYNRFYRPTEEF